MDKFTINFSDGGDSSVGISPINIELTCDEWFIKNLKDNDQYNEFRNVLEGIFSQYGQDFGFSSQDEEEQFLEFYQELTCEDNDVIKKEIDILNSRIYDVVVNKRYYSQFFKYGAKAIEILNSVLHD